MIEGLHCDVPGAELREILGKLVRKHADKVDRYTARCSELRASGDDAAAGDTRSVSDDKTTLASFERRCNEHEALVEEFTFMGEHVVAGETYRLAYDDLRKLEIVTSHRY